MFPPRVAACRGLSVDVTVINGLIGALPGGGIAALAIWFALRKDAQCTALMKQMADLATAQAVSTSEVKGVLDRILDAVRNGARS
jgi:hypothetical protein